MSETKCILGFYDAERWFEHEAPYETIENDSYNLSKSSLMSADSSILEFINTANELPIRFVTSGKKIAGLITLSDLQKLPVRVALFALITDLEMSMASRIEQKFQKLDDWMNLIGGGKEEVREKIRCAKENGTFVNEISLTQIFHKSKIIIKKRELFGFGDMTRAALECLFEDIRDLRDNIAHANYYAEFPEKAQSTCDLVKRIVSCRDRLLAKANSG